MKEFKKPFSVQMDQDYKVTPTFFNKKSGNEQPKLGRQIKISSCRVKNYI